MPASDKLKALLELANFYPSPHNGQPMVVRASSSRRLEIGFDTSRGLSAVPISYLFSFVTIGVFIRHLELCAAALGHRASVELALPPAADMAGPAVLPCGVVKLEYDVVPPDATLEHRLRTRQTSRKRYDTGLNPQQVAQLHAIASGPGMKLVIAEPHQAAKVIWLNQRAVFDDMFNEPVRRELDHWLRYTHEQKEQTRDGLAYDCMELSGPVLKAIVKHYRLLRWPVVASLLRQYYLRTMSDHSTVGYVVAPFETEQQSYQIGRYVIDLWLHLTAQGAYLHPFGTVVANEQAHADFARLVGLSGETRANYVSFIFRAGFSDQPVRSDRIPYDHHLLTREGRHD